MRQTGAGRHLILYDGVCGLCNSLVRFIIRRDHAAVFHFASLQSASARQFLLRSGIDPYANDTIFVIPNYESTEWTAIARAEAGLFIASHLGWPWRWIAAIKVLPSHWQDVAYDLVAKYRYRWFGKYSVCPLPSDRDKWRFLGV